MTPQEFITKWQRVNLSQRSACQQHFLDHCDLLGQPKPAAADPNGTFYTAITVITKAAVATMLFVHQVDVTAEVFGYTKTGNVLAGH